MNVLVTEMTITMMTMVTLFVLVMIVGCGDTIGRTKMAELKPCPFCGGDAEFDFAILDVKHEGFVTFKKAKCKSCKAQTNIYREREDAALAWNRRADDAL